MSANKRYYFLKLKENFFREETILLLEDCKDGFLYTNILLKMYLLSLKHEGQLLLTEGIAYTPAMIASLTHHQTGTVEKALQVFTELGLVEELQDGSLYMSNIQTMIGSSSTEAERKRQERLRLGQQLLLSPEQRQTSDDSKRAADNCGQTADTSGQLADICPEMSEKCPPEYRDKSIELRDQSSEFRVKKYGSAPSAGTLPKRQTDTIRTVSTAKSASNRLAGMDRASIRLYGLYRKALSKSFGHNRTMG